MPRDSAQETLIVSIGQYSDAGRKAENQDFHGATIPQGSALSLKGVTLAVADGISSSPTSREAAETAVKALMTDYYDTSDAWTVKTAATRVIGATNAWLFGQNHAVGDINSGKVTTLSALILKGRTGHVLHVGDSRVQRLTGASLEPLTTDHRITLSAGESYLARGLGVEETVEVDYRSVALGLGDVFLLTTDGVHGFVQPRDLHDVLAATASLDEAAQLLGERAIERGSDDNVTIQIARIEALPPDDALPDTDLARLPLGPLPKAGDTLDGFRIVRPLHSTARSHVFLASGPTGQRVALKVPTVEMASDPAYLRRFVLEEWIARRISSAHVLRAAEAPVRRSALYAITEFVEGQTLRQWMADNPDPSLEDVRNIIGQIIAGLRAFHRREMLHQDIRPENIIIDGDGTVKIIDLGSTAVAGVEEAAPGVLGNMPGTFQYTAPEYLAGDEISWRSDQFAVAVIAYEMLTGCLPYGAQVARIGSRRDLARLRYRPARDDDNNVPAWMDAALAKALHPDPLRRYDALSEFLADLKTPGTAWKESRHVPLAERNPLRFWQSISATLALICLVLIYQLAH